MPASPGMGDLTIHWPDAGAKRVGDAVARLEAARGAVLARPLEDLVAVVGRVLERFGKADAHFGARLVERLPEATGFETATIARGLEHALAHWDLEAVSGLVDLELGPSLRAGRVLRPHARTSVVLAGGIPMPTLVACLTPLLVRSPVLVKTASRDRVTAHLVAECLRDVDAELGACLEVLDLEGDDEAALDAFLDAPCILASGSDEALREIAARGPVGTRFVGYGHRFSVALVDANGCTGDRLDQAAAELAHDVAAWDQSGCLSPICAHVVGGDAGAAARVASTLGEALEALAEDMPRGTVPTEVAACIRSERDEAAMRAAAGRTVTVHASEDTAWTVALEDEPALRAAPLHRFLRVHPAPDFETWAEVIEPAAAQLSTVGFAGFGDERDHPVLGLATALGASRVCPLGEMQAPPLDWPHDGEPVLAPLARWSGVAEIL